MKTNFNFKLLITLGIMLLTLLAFNSNIVNATELSANALDSVPDTIEVGIPSTEAIDDDGYISAKLSDILYTEVIISIANEDISSEQLSIGFAQDKLLDSGKADVKLYDNDSNLVAEKTVTIKYTDNWNTTDSEYVNNKCANLPLDLGGSLYIEYGDTRDCEEIIEEAFAKLINDSSIKCTFHTSLGTWSYPEFYAHGIFVFTKNDVVYYTVSTTGIYGTGTMTIPQSVEDTDEAFMNYALSILKADEKFANEELRMEKNDGGEGYLLYVSSVDPYVLILNKDASKTDVVSTDKDTNVKLKTTAAVVPIDTVMQVTAIKEGTTFDTVEKVMSDAKTFKVFDITLESNGKKIQPNGNVTISIPIPSDMGTENLVACRIAEDGEKTEYKVTIEAIDGTKYATFETNHFSTYVLAELSVQENKTPSTNSDKLDDSPKTGESIIINIISLVAMISFAGVVILKRK